MNYGILANIQIRIVYLSVTYQKIYKLKCVTVLPVVFYGHKTSSPTIRRSIV